MTGAVQLRRIAILGAESSGKSTLAEALALRYETLWVPEYLREFVDTHGRVPQEHEQILIARTQLEREAALAAQAQRYLFCDTTPIMTDIYSRHCFGRPDQAVADLAARHAYGLTLVAAPDCPWEPDGLQRMSDDVRQLVHGEVLQTLARMQIHYVDVHGPLTQRIEQVAALLAALPD
jgi:NadR type nicotinamide-nucleotide adenylyltransferase